jgi:hypothetical protein
MRVPEFNWQEASWDEFKKFHNNSSLFVFFDDGGVYMRSNTIKPNHRYTYAAMNVKIFRSNDSIAPTAMYDPDGNKVTKKSLNNHEFLWDLDTNKVYALSGAYAMYQQYSPTLKDLTPKYIQDKSWRTRFYRHPDGRIVSAPVGIYKPEKYDDETEEHLKTLLTASKAWVAMTQPDMSSPWRFGTISADYVKNKTFAMLDDHDKIRLSLRGISRRLTPSYVPHLVVKYP